jgi:hypothetical protein
VPSEAADELSTVGVGDLKWPAVHERRYRGGFQMSAPRPAAVTRSSAIGYWSASIGSLAGGGAGRVTGQTALTDFQEFLGPGVIQALSDCFAAI